MPPVSLRFALTLAAICALVALSLSRTAELRARAHDALGKGMPAREAALARGFVLGQDEEVDARTSEDFRRAGLSHLLAVSGQNVALLALLAMPLLAALAIPLRMRLLWMLALIAIYVPLTGAGPSIQRAGVMGALSILATLAGRRTSRFYALALAALLTLAIDPGVAADVGWQLSFAAVLGILLLASPLREALSWGPERPGRLGRTLLEGAAMTIAATLATAPLIAFHFGELSTVTLLANLLALPAVAPAMWLGMLSIGAAQVPSFPVAPLNALNAPLLAYIAQIAAWCGRPSWACLKVELGAAGLVASYAVIVLLVVFALRFRRRRTIAALRQRRKSSRRRPAAARRLVPATLLLAALTLAALAFAGGSGATGTPTSGLRVSVLDVGQGDAILLQPAGAPPILVDGGPPGDGLAGKLRNAGVGRLGAAIVTHDQSDHAGGIAELLGRFPIERLLYAILDRQTLAEAHASGMATERIAKGEELRSGSLRLDVIWPPPELLEGSHLGEDPNRLALVMLVRWHSFSMLLTADAEAESTPIDPGPVDVLKVAHHGSEDAGLDDLLDRTAPRLAVISVGADNPYGHPSLSTLASLAKHGIETLRTDRDGTIVIDVSRHSMAVTSDG